MQAPDGSPPCLAGAARDAVEGVREQVDIEGRMERSPYGTVAAALGLGYVLGGGLFTPLTARGLGVSVRLGMRLILVPIVTEQLMELAMSAAAGRPPAKRSGSESISQRNGAANPRAQGI